VAAAPAARIVGTAGARGDTAGFEGSSVAKGGPNTTAALLSVSAWLGGACSAGELSAVVIADATAAAASALAESSPDSTRSWDRAVAVKVNRKIATASIRADTANLRLKCVLLPAA
jgi:hypothetical protein